MHTVLVMDMHCHIQNSSKPRWHCALIRTIKNISCLYGLMTNIKKNCKVAPACIFTNMPAEPTWKSRAKPGNPYECMKQKEKVLTHKSLAQPPKQTSHLHLMTGDWLIVFKHVDDHPSHRNADIVAYFANWKEGALLFTQPTLSQKLASHAKIEQCTNENPNALLSKKSHVVTWPDVEHAIVAWYQKMQLRGETVTGAMLMEKRRQIENLMDVPEDQCLKGEGWLRSFCKAWKIQEIQRHGKAGSVDLVAVEKECICLCGITAKYAMWDRWNIDESGFVIFAIPDCTLSSGPMSGRKQDKFCWYAVYAFTPGFCDSVIIRAHIYLRLAITKGL